MGVHVIFAMVHLLQLLLKRLWVDRIACVAQRHLAVYALTTVAMVRLLHRIVLVVNLIIVIHFNQQWFKYSNY